MALTKTMTFYRDDNEDDAGEEYELEVPARWKICSRCKGNGHHSNPSIDGNGITQSEWAEWDEEDREKYMRGAYDVCCECCSGTGKVLVVDTVLFKERHPKEYRCWCKREKEDAKYRAIADSEARWEHRMLYGSEY
jgi:RecJ-like exonuclease